MPAGVRGEDSRGSSLPGIRDPGTDPESSPGVQDEVGYTGAAIKRGTKKWARE